MVSQSPVMIRGLDNNDAFQFPKHQNNVLSVTAQGGEEPFYWFLNGALLPEENRTVTLTIPNSGNYQLTLTDQTGATDSVEFSVERY